MDVAPAPIEVEAMSEPTTQASANEPTATVEQRAAPGNEVPRQQIRAVFLNTPMLRLAKMLLGATLCTVILNPPSSFVSRLQIQPVSGAEDSAADYKGNAVAIVEASDISATRNIVRSQRVRTQPVATQLVPTTIAAAAAAETAGAQALLPVLGEATSPDTNGPAVIAAAAVEAAGAPDLLPVPRETTSPDTAGSAVETPHEEVVHKEEIPRSLVRKEGASAVLGKDNQTELLQDSEGGPAVPEEVKQPEVVQNSEEPKATSMSLVLSLLAETWHIAIAVTVLTGFVLELRRSGADLLRNLPGYLVSKVPFIVRQ